MATLGRRPRIPSLFSTISNNIPPRSQDRQRGRAYKPPRKPRQHSFASVAEDGLGLAANG